MPILAAQISAALFLILGTTYIRIHRYVNYVGSVPRIGKSGVLGYIYSALRYTLDAEAVILEGKSKYSNQPFTIPTLSGPVFLLGPEYLDKVKSSPDEVLNDPLTVNEDLQLPFTMDKHQLANPYQADVLRMGVNRTLPSYIPELLEESVLATGEVFENFRVAGHYEVPVFDTMTQLIAQISNRVILGLGICRNKAFLHAVVRFAETVPLMAPFISWTPKPLRPLVHFILSRILGGKHEVLRYLLPYLQTQLYEKQGPLSETTTLVAEHLMNSAPAEETLQGLAIRLLNLNFGSIHTSSIFITQTLFEIALLDPNDVDSVRNEVLDAIKSEQGWTKAAVLRFKKIDSALKEVGRVYGLMHFALPRYTMVQFNLENGLFVPPGYKVAIDMKAVHYNPEVYPEPTRCDLFRFSKLRDTGGSDTKHSFSAVNADYLPFGAGKHTCAGRFFAATELKIMLAHILLNYDISLPEHTHTRPKNILFDGAIIPDTKARLVFKPRSPPIPNFVLH